MEDGEEFGKPFFMFTIWFSDDSGTLFSIKYFLKVCNVSYVLKAFQVSSLEKLDQTLASCLMWKMPTGGFQGLQCDQSPAGGKGFSSSE